MSIENQKHCDVVIGIEHIMVNTEMFMYGLLRPHELKLIYLSVYTTLG